MSWNDGYVSDVPYAIGYYREMSLNHIGFAAVSNGTSIDVLKNAERIIELGIGMGLSIILAAASNPSIAFEGYDFNPEHISHARALSRKASLTNLQLSELSFADIASAAREGQQDVDVIQLHGILTWVSAEAHESIVEIARKRLKPGGFLYVSYNCMPGWSAFFPIQRLLRQHAKAKGKTGSSVVQTKEAVEYVKMLSGKEGRFFLANPSVFDRIEKLAKLSPSYLAHEYLNENWFIFHFAEVSKMMSRAKLTYIASATLAENMDGIAVPEQMRALTAEATDSDWKETLRDFASNKQFRRDLYVRGPSKLVGSESLSLLDQMRFTLSIPREQLNLKIKGPIGDLDAKPELYFALADAMTLAFPTFTELTHLPAFESVGPSGLLQALALMIHSEQAFPILDCPNNDIEVASKINKEIVDLALLGRVYNFLAAPAVGSGIKAATIDLIILGGLNAGVPENTAAMIDFVMETMDRLGIKPAVAGAIVEDNSARELISNSTKTLFEQTLPVWRHLKVCK